MANWHLDDINTALDQRGFAVPLWAADKIDLVSSLDQCTIDLDFRTIRGVGDGEQMHASDATIVC